MADADELRRQQQEQRTQRERLLESETVRRAEREKYAKDSADAERVLRDLENKINQGPKKP
jgi:hypothetical protein